MNYDILNNKACIEIAESEGYSWILHQCSFLHLKTENSLFIKRNNVENIKYKISYLRVCPPQPWALEAVWLLKCCRVHFGVICFDILSVNQDVWVGWNASWRKSDQNCFWTSYLRSSFIWRNTETYGSCYITPLRALIINR